MKCPTLLILAVLASGIASANAADVAFLKAGHLWCREEADVAELADAAPGPERARLLASKSDRGDCSDMPDMIGIETVGRRTTRRGNAYVCYKPLVPTPGGEAEVECSLPSHLTTLAAELRARKGDFRIVADSDVAKLADCVEGGRVLLGMYPGGRRLWSRHAMLFPIDVDPVELRPGPLNVDRAFRDGCKGIDYKASR